MERTTFSEKFMEDLKKQLEQSGEKYLVSTNEVQKMNLTYEAITVKPENGLVGVNLNFSEIYERYASGVVRSFGVEKVSVAGQGISSRYRQREDAA